VTSKVLQAKNLFGELFVFLVINFLWYGRSICSIWANVAVCHTCSSYGWGIVTPAQVNVTKNGGTMKNKRLTTIQARVTDQERTAMEAIARHLRRNRSDALRTIILEKAEALGLIEKSLNLIDKGGIDDKI
jgi:hypothetical protein